MEKAEKAAIMAKFARHEGDVGSSEVQIAVLTGKIKELTEHMKTHKKDHSSRRGLMMMVNNRKKLLKHLSGEDHDKFVKVADELGIRGQK